MKVYVLRHGTTDWNEAKKLQGNSNTKLNEKGRALAAVTAKALSSVEFTHVFSSPLDRAYETAEIIMSGQNAQNGESTAKASGKAETGKAENEIAASVEELVEREHRKGKVEIVKDPRLMEVGFGIDEGVVMEKRTPGCRLFFEAPAEYVPAEGAESIESLLDRTGNFINEVLVPLSLSKPDAVVLISGHGAMNKALMTNFLHREVKNFWDGAWQKNCSISIYEVKGKEFTLLEDGVNYCE